MEIYAIGIVNTNSTTSFWHFPTDGTAAEMQQKNTTNTLALTGRGQMGAYRSYVMHCNAMDNYGHHADSKCLHTQKLNNINTKWKTSKTFKN